jgi:Tat protein secretion system quality control protein TatD with DNase activity
MIQNIPLELLALETDAPIPFSGKPSSPAWIPKIAQKVCEIKKIELEDLQKSQMSIFKRFFPHYPIKHF